MPAPAVLSVSSPAEPATDVLADRYEDLFEILRGQGWIGIDFGLAYLLYELHGDHLRYCRAEDRWYCWTGQRWEVDQTGEAERKAKDVLEQMMALDPESCCKKPRRSRQDRDGYDDEETQDAFTPASRLARWAWESARARAPKDMLALAKVEKEMAIKPEDMDSDPWLFATANGLLDLRTGRHRQARPCDMVSMASPVSYDPKATCPRFEATVATLVNHDQEMVSYLQRALGSALCGDTRDQAIYILHGGGQNGKSTILDAVAYVLGDYAKPADPQIIMRRRERGIPLDLARLRKSRMVTVAEPPDRVRLDESRIKQITGGEHVIGRHLYSEEVAYKPQFKMFVATNPMPEIADMSEGMWRRIKLIECPVRIPDEKRDVLLPEKLRAEAAGILRWLVRGCLEWQKHGLGAPAAVVEATRGYRSEMDTVEGFVASCCVREAGAKVQAGTLYKAYQEWCRGQGFEVLTDNAFGRRLSAMAESMGFEAGRSAKGNLWRGLALCDVG